MPRYMHNTVHDANLSPTMIKQEAKIAMDKELADCRYRMVGSEYQQELSKPIKDKEGNFKIVALTSVEYERDL